jgi:DNA helicase HerA-like ATPase
LECGTLVVADLTDPMLSADEANGIFQVLLEQFRKKRLDCGKVLACDEAHKYLTGAGNGREELAAAIVDVVRLMRHDGIRVLISTQSPLALPPELLELVSVTILHSFQSKDWYAYLSSKIHLPEGLFAQIRGLYPGQALVVATKTDVVAPKKDECNDDHCLALQIRPRLTTDLGRSRVHK